MNINKKASIRKLLKRYEDLKCLEYKPFWYQEEDHKATEPIVIVQSGNQIGKSEIAARELSYWFRGYHPYKKLTKTSNLIIWACSETLSLAIQSIYEAKLKHKIPEKEYREIKEAGGTITAIEHKITKNRIYFKSYAKGSSRLQSVPVDLVVIDEQPGWDEFMELRQRTRATRRITGQSQIYLTFTPLKIDRDLQDYITNRSEDIKHLHITAYDCPIFTREELDNEKQSLPEREFKIRYLGEWANFEGALIPSFTDECIVEDFEIPKGWKTVLGVDPASSGLLGACILVEDPKTKIWYMTKEMQVKGQAPQRQVELYEEFSKQVVN